VKLRSDFFLRHLSSTDIWVNSPMINTNKEGNILHDDSHVLNQKRYLGSAPIAEPLTTTEYVKHAIQFLRDNTLLPNCIEEDTYEIQLGILYDSSYCEDNGNTVETTQEAIDLLILNVNKKFTTTNLCVEFSVTHLDGECGSQDLVGSLVDITDASKRLKEFKKLWNENKNDEFDVDIALLITGEGTVMVGSNGIDGDEREDSGRYYGFAYSGGLCRPVFKFGVNAITKTTDRNCPPSPEAVVAHELGHLLGADHYSSGDEEYIMQSKIGPFAGEEGFSGGSFVAMRSKLKSNAGTNFDCVEMGSSKDKESVVIGVEKMPSLGFVSSLFLSIVVIGSYWVKKRRI